MVAIRQKAANPLLVVNPLPVVNHPLILQDMHLNLNLKKDNCNVVRVHAVFCSSKVE